jgi:hypothetical protein
MGDSMKETNDALWLAFEALAKTYPRDDGVRMTADLARWLLEEHQRRQLPVPSIAHKIVLIAIRERHAAIAEPLRWAPVTSQ